MNQSRIVQRVVALAAYSALALTPAIGNCDALPPADSLWSQQWNMSNSGQSGGTPGIDIGLLGAWEFTTGSSDVIVAIMRDVAQSTHPDFIPATGSNRIVPDVDNPGTYTLHGTLIGGIIAAEANNGGSVKRGIAGIDQHCIVWNYLNNGWPYGHRNGDDIRNAADAGVDVMNISYAVSDEDDGQGLAIVYAYNRDVVIVASTGNNNDQQPRYPAAFDGVIAVGGLRDVAQRATHSNYGPHVDLVAPDGDAILDPSRWITSLSPPSGYTTVKGTSYACPHVVGAAALLRGAHPELSNDDIANVLTLSAMDLLATGRDDFTGHGLVTIDSAFRILELPNKLRQWSGGASVHQVTLGAFPMHLSVGTGVYLGYKYELRQTVNFDRQYHNLISVWTRGSSSLGLKDSSYMYETHHTEIVPGTLTETSVVLRTFVYELWDLADEYVGWKPCRPEDAIVSYGILGEELLVAPTLYGTV